MLIVVAWTLLALSDASEQDGHQSTRSRNVLGWSADQMQERECSIWLHILHEMTLAFSTLCCEAQLDIWSAHCMRLSSRKAGMSAESGCGSQKEKIFGLSEKFPQPSAASSEYLANKTYAGVEENLQRPEDCGKRKFYGWGWCGQRCKSNLVNCKCLVWFAYLDNCLQCTLILLRKTCTQAGIRSICSNHFGRKCYSYIYPKVTTTVETEEVTDNTDTKEKEEDPQGGEEDAERVTVRGEFDLQLRDLKI